MNKFAIALILTFLFSGLLSGGEFSTAAQPTQQGTHGPNSPVAYTSKGNITITINELKEIEKVIKEAIESYENGRDIEKAELKKRIANIHKTQLNVLPEEADKWADQFISTMPLRKDRVITEESEATIRFEKHRANVPILIEYCIKKFDEYILALKKHDKNINIKQEQIPKIISSPQEYGSLRTVSFPNGAILTFRLWTGVIVNDDFGGYPHFRIDFMHNGPSQCVLWVEPEKASFHRNSLGYVKYGKHRDGELTDEFKKSLTRAYDIIIQEAYLRSSKAPARRLNAVD